MRSKKKQREAHWAHIRKLGYWGRIKYEILFAVFVRTKYTWLYGFRWNWDKDYRRRMARLRWTKRRPNSLRNKKHAKFLVAKRDGWKCNNPNCPHAAYNILKWKTPRLTLDHVIPVGKGGKDELSNWQLLCRDCHDVKDGMVKRTEPREEGEFYFLEQPDDTSFLGAVYRRIFFAESRKSSTSSSSSSDSASS